MLFRNSVTGQYPISADGIRLLNPNVSFPGNFEEAPGFDRVHRVEPPDHDHVTQYVQELPPEVVGGRWQQVWKLHDFSPEDVAARRRAMRVSNVTPAVEMRQFRRALLKMGVLQDVVNYVESAPQEVKIDWEFETRVRREAELAGNILSGLGWTDEKLDEVFNLAGTL